MSEDRSPAVLSLEAHESFMEHIEAGAKKIKVLSITTIVVSLFLSASYLTQLVILPFFLGVRSITVNLLEPALMATEVAILALILAWLYVGLRDLAFVTRLSDQVSEIRKLQSELERKITA